MIGVWYYRFRPKIPAGMDIRLSQAETVDPDELDEEFDTIPSSRRPEVIRARYDRLRILAVRVQTILGDFAAQGERIQALVSWRDPRATKLFIAMFGDHNSSVCSSCENGGGGSRVLLSPASDVPRHNAYGESQFFPAVAKLVRSAHLRRERRQESKFTKLGVFEYPTIPCDNLS
ncbi:Phosphoribosyltransferase C-terminal [Arabidopsis thaliana x Arabidopsis arenosa]|uniref:Phosphoribosyltransferase C-terminal n=1 Tax=Arabidopsis thaliana x Arabidopsis arenosa TaxID=1240361 RepID=A0A8T1XH09_9BRAS|nr:Phosphoribosyltransferase C-terminal [Arabidopsis thaliana x Arabidopsis arenosa]